jgi:hypothetical protein
LGVGSQRLDFAEFYRGARDECLRTVYKPHTRVSGQAGASFESQATKRPTADMRAKAIGAPTLRPDALPCRPDPFSNHHGCDADRVISNA